MTYVLDASAMIAFLRDEPGAGVVSDALLDPESQCDAHALNLCEVFYDFRRASNHELASQAICFAIELAERLNATILTADHHEFDALAGQAGFAIKFIR